MQPTKRNQLIEYAVDSGLITREQVFDIQRIEKTTNESFLQILADSSLIPAAEVARLFKEFYNIDFLDVVETVRTEQDAVNLINFDMAIERNLLPLKIQDGNLYIAMGNPFDKSTLNDLSFVTKLRVVPVFAEPKALKTKISQTYSKKQINSIANCYALKESNVKQSQTSAEIQNAPAVMIVDSIIQSAVMSGASDIHIEPFEDKLRIRFRNDGVLRTYENLDIKLLPSIASRFKIMAHMDISERRLPQDGYFESQPLGINFRVSVAPTIYGEKIVIRLLYKAKYIISKEDLGFFPEDLDKINNLLRSPFGAIIVTGPTGSGKTTTLASFVNELNKDSVNIVTVEDPVEIVIKGITQININLKAGLDFNNILRFILRQDPDVLLIGEIRDSETARTAIQAAITGHLVLTTLHTNDAVSSIIRLMDMGIEPYLMPAAVKGVIAQRLVRRICPKCKASAPPNAEDVLALHLPKNMKAFVGRGCDYCGHTGYKGRLAVYEILLVDYKLKEVIDSGAPVGEILSHYVKAGMVTMRENTLRNVRLGNTTIEEMYKVVYGI